MEVVAATTLLTLILFLLFDSRQSSPTHDSLVGFGFNYLGGLYGSFLFEKSEKSVFDVEKRVGVIWILAVLLVSLINIFSDQLAISFYFKFLIAMPTSQIPNLISICTKRGILLELCTGIAAFIVFTTVDASKAVTDYHVVSRMLSMCGTTLAFSIFVFHRQDIRENTRSWMDYVRNVCYHGAVIFACFIIVRIAHSIANPPNNTGGVTYCSTDSNVSKSDVEFIQFHGKSIKLNSIDTIMKVDYEITVWSNATKRKIHCFVSFAKLAMGPVRNTKGATTAQVRNSLCSNFLLLQADGFCTVQEKQQDSYDIQNYFFNPV